jgi:hypothetical protein
MPRHPVRSLADLPNPPKCDEVYVRLVSYHADVRDEVAHGIRGVLSNRYGMEVDGVTAEERHGKPTYFPGLLGQAGGANALTVHGVGCRLEYEEPWVSKVPPRETTTMCTLDFFIERDT